MKPCELPLEVPDFYNKERLNALYRPFRHSDPVMVRDLTSFWRSTVSRYLLKQCTCSIRVSSFQEAFDYEGKRPSCIPELAQQLWKNSELLEPWRFAEYCLSSFTSKAISFLIKSPLEWVISRVKSPFSADDVLIHVNTCMQLSDELFSWLMDHCSTSVFSLQTFRSIVTTSPVLSSNTSKLDIEVILIMLLRKLKLFPIYSDDSVLVNLTQSGSLLKSFGIVGVSTSKLKSFSNKDLESLLKLKILEFNFKFKTESLCHDIDHFSQISKHLLKQSKKMEAISVLKRKQHLFKVYKEKAGILENLTQIITAIEQAHDSKLIISTLKEGNSIIQKICPSADDVSAIMDDCSVSLSLVHDASAVTSMVEDSEVIDAEYQQLEKEIASLALETEPIPSHRPLIEEEKEEVVENEKEEADEPKTLVEQQ
ncbi:hypothetical protein P9112_004648 [Eukaryota sp. TZLM1-RC]